MLTAAEQKELEELERLEQQASQPKPTGLTPEEAKELEELERLEANTIAAKPVEAEPTKASNLLASRATPDSTVEQIAKKHNVDPEWLKSQRSWLGGLSDSADLSSFAKEAIGTVGSTLAGPIPGFVMKKMQDDPKRRAAMDELINEVNSNKSYLQGASEFLVGLGTGIGAAGKAGKLIKGASEIAPVTTAVVSRAVPTVGGAATGVASSEEGKELQGGVTGALFGYTLGTWLPSKARKRITKAVEDEAGVITAKTEKVLAARAPQTDKEKELLDKLFTKDAKTFLEKTDDSVASSLLNKNDLRAVKQGTQIHDRLAIQLTELDLPLTPENLLKMRAYEKATSIGRRLGAKKGEGIEELVRTTDLDKLKERYDYGLLGETAAKVAGKNKGTVANWSDLFSKGMLWTTDAKPLSQAIDRKLGLSGNLSMEKTLDDISGKINAMRIDTFKAADKVDKLATEASKANLKPSDITAGLQSGRTDGIFGQYREALDNLVDVANDYGVKIDYRKDYVPSMRKSPLAYRAAMLNEIDRLGKELKTDLFNMNPAEFKQASKNKDFKELIGELEVLSPEGIKGPDALRGVLGNVRVNNRAASNILGVLEATAAKRRVDAPIPAWAQETDINKMLNKWVNQTLKVGAINNDLTRLGNVARVAEAAGDIETSKHINELVEDIRGRRGEVPIGENIRSQYDRFKSGLLRRAQGKSGIDKQLATGAAYIVQGLEGTINNIYPSLISRPYHMVQNVISPAMMIGPELGSKGAAVYLGSLGDVADQLRRGKLKELNQQLQKAGLYPPQWKGEYVKAIKENLVDDNLTRITGKANDKLAAITMAGFEKSEFLARASSYFMGRRVAGQMLKNPDFTAKFLDNLSSPAYKREFTNLIKEGNLEKLENSVAKYFNSNHLFNYDKVNMARYARTLGPMFSIFAKWPTAMAGKVATNYLNQGLAKGTEKNISLLVGPWAGLQLADQVLELDNSEDPRVKAWLGSKGLSGMSGADSVFGLGESVLSGDITGGLLNSPIVQLGKPFYDAAQAEDPEEAVWKALDQTYNTVGPAAGMLKIVGQDIPRILGEEPAKEDYKTETLIEGAKQVPDLLKSLGGN